MPVRIGVVAMAAEPMLTKPRVRVAEQPPTMFALALKQYEGTTRKRVLTTKTRVTRMVVMVPTTAKTKTMKTMLSVVMKMQVAVAVAVVVVMTTIAMMMITTHT